MSEWLVTFAKANIQKSVYLNDGWDNLSSLRQGNPDLAEDFQNLRSEASEPINFTPGLAATGTIRGRGDVARQFDRCLGQIRKLAGYERFLMAPSLEELESETWRARKKEAHELDEGFLSWLWSSYVESVLEELPPSSDNSRVWWISSGIANSVPFRAAGHHVAGSMDNTLSRTIPSYTSTVKSLAYARSCAARSMGSQPEKTSVLMVAIPETPGQPALSEIVKEYSIVQESLSHKSDLTSLVKPSVKQVKSHLTGSDIVHFACHGVSDQTYPSDRHMMLHKDWL